MAATNKYVIHAHIIAKGEKSYVVKARTEPVFRSADSAAPAEEATCEPCEYAQARTACYKFVAHIAHMIGKSGGEVTDVVITDATDR